MNRLFAPLIAFALMIGTAVCGVGVAEGWIVVPVERNLGQQSVNGVLTDVKVLSVTVAPRSGKSVEMRVNAKTIVKRKGIRIPVTELKVGEMVQATYRLEEKKNVALTITVVGK